MTNCYFLDSIYSQNKAEISGKMKETEFPVNMHIYTLCPKNLQRITIFRAALFELRLQQQQQQQPLKQLPKIRNVGRTVILVNAFIKSDNEEI